MLESLALACGQPGAMNWLRYFLDTATAARKPPYLVLMLHSERPLHSPLRQEDCRAAALFFEYRVLGWRTGVLAADDMSGFHTVVALERERTSMTAIAVRALMEEGAHVVLTTCEGAVHDRDVEHELNSLRGVQWASQQRQLKKTMRLGRTLEETLAGMGKSARFKLRYYRRRLLRSAACEFVGDMRGSLSDLQCAALNAGSLNPVAPEEFQLRLSSACEPGGFLVGLRHENGQWLSLVGGWRQGDLSVLHWQMNTAGYEKDSIGTVMRSYFLEHEIERGTRRLLIYGGTPHSMRHAFEVETVGDLLVRRRSLRARMLCAVAPVLAAERGRFGRGNFLAQTISSPDLHWRQTSGLPADSSPAQPRRNEAA